VGEKRWSGFGQGMSDQIGAHGAGGLLAGSKWMARCASYWVGLVGSAGRWCAGWLGAFPIDDAPMCIPLMCVFVFRYLVPRVPNNLFSTRATQRVHRSQLCASLRFSRARPTDASHESASGPAFGLVFYLFFRIWL
jgi:hypothetical protein